MNATKPLIEIRDLVKIYGSRPDQGLALLQANTPVSEMSSRGYITALNRIDLTIEAGQICVIMGLSGSGKSTLLRCINRLVTPTAGELFVDGVDVMRIGGRELRSLRLAKLGMVFQHFAIFPHMTVTENVAFGLRVLGVKRDERSDRAAKALKLVGLDGWGGRKPRDLSGGMRQRVGLARALVMDSPILLMDEPFSALDPLLREEMQQELLRLQTTLHKTIVFVTHDPNEAIALGDHIVILLKGQVAQQGTPSDIVTSPANDYVRNFVKGVSILRVLTAGQAIDAAYPAVDLAHPNVSALASARGRDLLPVVDGEGAFLGIFDRRSSSGAWPGTAADWRSAVVGHRAAVVAPDAPMGPLMDKLSDDHGPLVVAEPNGRFVGVVTNRSLVQALCDGSAERRRPKPDQTASTTHAPPPRDDAWRGVARIGVVAD